jgi:hypothetical protein
LSALYAITAFFVGRSRYTTTNVPDWVAITVGLPVALSRIFRVVSQEPVFPESELERIPMPSLAPHRYSMCVVPPLTTRYGSAVATPAPIMLTMRFVVHVHPESVDQAMNAVSRDSPACLP